MNTKKAFFSLLLFCGVFFSALAQDPCPPFENTSILLKIETAEYSIKHCASGNAGMIYINNTSGKFKVKNWYYSHDNKNPHSWYIVKDSIRDSLHFQNLNKTTYYRALVSYGTCTDLYTTNEVTIDISPVTVPGKIVGISKGCRYAHSGTLNLEDNVGDIVSWQEQKNSIPWNDILNTANKSEYKFKNLAEKTFYRVIVKSGVCAQDTSTIGEVNIYELPVSNFTEPHNCFGKEVTFIDQSTKVFETDNYIKSYLWNFEDGTTSTETNPKKTFDHVRIHNVTLTAITNNGCKQSITKAVDVYPIPEPNFQAPNVCLGTPTQFTNTSSITAGTITGSYWLFGDISNNSNKDPIHKYAEAKKYNVKLYVESEHTCSAEITKEIQVYKNPVASFSATTPCLGLATLFTNNTITEDGLLSRFSWTFGDGGSSILQNTEHTFTQSGKYTTKLYAETNLGCKDSIEQEIKVNYLPMVDFSITNACDGFPVKYTNNTTIPEGTIAEYIWNFGEGSLSNEESPEKLYFNPATYNVYLEAISDKGCRSTINKPAIVYKNPIADFSVENVCFNTPIQLINKSIIRNTENLIYDWDLADGNKMVNREFQYTYLQPGYYPIKLIITSDQGKCQDSIIKTVQVYQLPKINAGKDLLASLGYPLELMATGGITYSWTPSAGLSSTSIANPLATPKQTTTYTVTSVDEYGCVNSDSVVVAIINDNKVIPTNLITPDGNGQNDTWVITNIDNYSQAIVKIFDKHGKEVYGTKNYQNNWDGRNRNGDVLPDGTYYYLIYFEDNGRTYKGPITVLRNK